MYPSVCVIALIFLSFENVSGCNSWFSSKESPRKGNSGNNKGTPSFTCLQRYLDGNQQEAIAEHKITPEQTNFENTHFIIKVEIFDNNTEIYCTEDGKNVIIKENTPVSAEIGDKQTVFYFSTSNFGHRTTLMVSNGTATAKEEPAISKYNDTKKVSFNCTEHISETNIIQLGLINPATNMIKTVPGKTLNQEFNKTHNGTILCCIYYVVNGTEDRWITRHVDSKTLLLYDDGNDVDDKDNGQQEPLKPTEMSTNETNTQDDTDPGNDFDPGSHTKKYVIATAAVAAVFILIVVIVIWKKCCRKKPKSDAKVLYADLDLLRQTAPETSQRPKPSPGPEEESPYAQIIGQMRPQ